MRIFIRYIVMGISLLFCTHTSFSQIKRSKLNVYIHTNKSRVKNPGLVVGSIAIVKSKMIYDHYYLAFSGWREENTVEIISGSKRFKKTLFPDVWQGDTAVYLFAYKRNSGVYKLDYSSYYTLPATYAVTYNPGERTDLPLNKTFNVKQNRVTYVGEIVIDVNKNETSISDRSKRDLSIIAERYADERWNFKDYLNEVTSH